jgi:hypothetical protein
MAEKVAVLNEEHMKKIRFVANIEKIKLIPRRQFVPYSSERDF